MDFPIAHAHLIHAVPDPPPEPGPLDWMDWERRKALRLLLAGRGTRDPSAQRTDS